MDFVAVQCPHCSSTKVAEYDGRHYRCGHCGSMFLRATTGPGEPPAPPPAKKASPAPWVALALIVPLGLVGLAGATGGVLYLTKRRSAVAPGPRTPLPHRPPNTVSAPAPEPPKARLASVREGRTIVKGAFWLVSYENVGKTPIGRPSVRVSLFDAAGRRLTEQQGWARRQILPPGESTVVLVSVPDVPAFARSEVAPQEPEAPQGWEKEAGVSVAEFTVQPRGSSADVVGTVKNDGASTLRFVQAVVVGRGADGTPVSYGDGYASVKELAPRASSGFKVSLGTWQIEPPLRYEVFAVGRPRD
ncbi:MAG TPA: FxLYD domain-containing protein [Polyangiaceae bacterium]|nr:FxLYD domain-containing protein [Polyangiaceae bacterium]